MTDLKSCRSIVLAILISLAGMPVLAQDSLDVTFRYYPNDNALRAYAPGEFNNWGNNNGGTIPVNDPSLMTEDSENGFWYKIIRLQVGGGGTTLNSATGYAYKFHEQYNASGTEWQWYSDPLNSFTVGPNSDSFLEVIHPNVFQMEPQSGKLFTSTDLEFWSNISGTNADPIDLNGSEIYINDKLLSNFTDNWDAERSLLHFDLNSQPSLDTMLVSGQNEFRIEVLTEDGVSRSESTVFSYLGNLEIVDEPRPEGLKDGITYNESDPTKATLSLFAPGKESVFVIGDFNDWTVDVDFQMKRDSLNADSVWFWIELSGMTPGLQYGYQYVVDQSLVIADPYAPLLLHPSEDQGIPSSTFPDLKAYPEGKTSGYVGILEPGKEDFEWQVTDFEKPAKEELVIYELLLRDFLADHNYLNLVDTLDYLDRLGINAIELMPVTEFDGNESWGYNPASHIALDKSYGAPEAFKTFVDEAHKRGIAVIIDVVYNHATGRNSLYQMYSKGSNPYFNESATHAFSVFEDFNHSYSGTDAYVKRTVQYLISEYKVDGFRWDLTKGFTQNCTSGDANCTGIFQSDRVAVLKKYADYQWEIDPDFYVIFEHLGTNNEEKEWANYRVGEGKGIMLWGNMNHSYNEATMGYGSDLTGVLSSSRGFQEKRLVGYMESHDEQWLMFKNISFGNSSGSYNVRDWGTALARQKLAGAFFFTLPGPKMIWQFGELGYGYGNNGEQCLKPGSGNGDCKSTAPSRTGNKPIRWDYRTNPDYPTRVTLYKTWSALLKLRNEADAITDPDIISHDLSSDVKWIKIVGSDTDVVVVGNFGVEPDSLDLVFTRTGTWNNYFEGTEFSVEDANVHFDLEPGEFRIYTTKKFTTPEPGITVSGEIEKGDEPLGFRLFNNYPNPFNPTTKISFDIAKAGFVTLEVYDVTGRKVAELVNETKSPGSYTVTFNASNLSSGIYFARLKAGAAIGIQKMILLK